MSILAGGLANLRWGGQASGADGGPGGQPQGQTLVNDYEVRRSKRGKGNHGHRGGALHVNDDTPRWTLGDSRLLPYVCMADLVA